MRETWFPKSNPPAATLDVVDIEPLGKWERAAVVSLQGLVSRDVPSIWILAGEVDRTWLDVHRDKGYIQSYHLLADWRELFRKYRDACRGAVLVDEALYHGPLHAANVAACEDLVIATEDLAKELGIPAVMDLRGRFSTNAQGYEWLWNRYADKFSRLMAGIFHPDILFGGAMAYDIQWRGFLFWVSGAKPEEAGLRGTDGQAEQAVMTGILRHLPANIPVRGFPWHHGLGLKENPGVAWLSGLGKGHNPTSGLPNCCVTSGIRLPPERFSQTRLRKAAQRLTLDPGKIYIALTMTDGDNLGTWRSFFCEHFRHPAHGAVPMGWGMGPAAYDLIPALAEWYYERAVPGKHEFLCDVSGISYFYPELYGGECGSAREGVLSECLRWTGHYMKIMDMRHVRTYFDSEECEYDRFITRYFSEIPELDAVFDAYCRWKAKERLPYEQQVYQLAPGKPVFSAIMTPAWENDHGNVEGFYNDLREVVGDRRPAFVNGALVNWHFRSERVKDIFHSKTEDMVFVTPSQLADLYRQHCQV